MSDAVRAEASSGAVRETYHRVQGANILLYEPVAPGDNGRILVASMHGGLGRTLQHGFLRQLAANGFRTAYCVPDSASFIDQFLAMERCLELLRNLDGVEATVLMGQSRGAGLMSAFQKIAENGAGVFQGPERRLPIPDMSLTPVDGLMLLDANFGFMVMHVLSMNPALVREGNGLIVDPDLDPLNPANGWAPNARAHYAPEFRRRFVAAQRDRYRRLLAHAEERWRLIEAGRGELRDNEPILVPDAIGINNSPKLFVGDLSYFAHTRQAWPLVHRDGSVSTEVVSRIALDETNPGLPGTLPAAWQTTVKDLLWLEVTLADDLDYGEDHLSGVDFASSMTCSSGNVEQISCPLLVMGHTAGYEYITAEWSYRNARSADRSIAFMEGATHGWASADAATYGDTVAIEARYVSGWLTEPGRFLR
ncbi:MAG: hypothetical protein QM638_21260 [Nocardioides sp.]|uniref:hypothetical protein n=1 Tax=Nocardioides sp. TaxID=35761 RepID=UPI0039E3C279